MSKHSPAPWTYDEGHCAIRYQLPVGHPDRYDENDDGWRNVVSLYSACGGVEGNTDVELMTAAPDLLAALRAILPYAESRLEDMEECAEDSRDCPMSGPQADADVRKARDVFQAAKDAIAQAEGAR